MLAIKAAIKIRLEAPDANAIAITDVSGFYTGVDIEAALTEVGTREVQKDQTGFVSWGQGKTVPHFLTGTVTNTGFRPSGVIGLANGGYGYMWHSHTEKEMVNYDIFPGGMMTMMIIEAPGVAIP